MHLASFVPPSLSTGEHRPRSPRVFGPLSMLPASSSDSSSAESCSILCLHPFISSPPVIVIADSAGSLSHCVVLTQMGSGGDVDDDDARSQVKRDQSQVSKNINMKR